ncbi:hypothetical protein ATKI12_1775 [Kitasatospora sp. Ki12]
MPRQVNRPRVLGVSPHSPQHCTAGCIVTMPVDESRAPDRGCGAACRHGLRRSRGSGAARASGHRFPAFRVLREFQEFPEFQSSKRRTVGRTAPDGTTSISSSDRERRGRNE